MRFDINNVTPIGSLQGSLALVALIQTIVVAQDVDVKYCRFSAPATNTDTVFLEFGGGGVFAAGAGLIALPPGGDTGELDWAGEVVATSAAGGTINYLQTHLRQS